MRIALVSMPWAIFYRPSIQLGSLAAYLRDQGEIIVDCAHPYLEVARAIGFDAYNDISASTWAGEALYSALLFPENRQKAKVLFARQVPARKNDFPLLVNQLKETTTDWLARQDFSRHTLVGFSICFSQLLASLYCASRIKAKYPDTAIVFGGSACTPALGKSLLTTFPWPDYLITGEGERALSDLLRHLAGSGPLPIQALSRQQMPGPIADDRPHHQMDINALPCPDYKEYFTELAGQGQPFVPELPIEFSRGCWWNRCSFCNLNQQWCGYRWKTSARVVADVRLLARRHQCLDFFFTDNALPPAEAETFFRDMAGDPGDYRFFAEIRAPKDLEECTLYQRGGLRSIQVGIEALSDSLLKKMRKGVTVMENIHAMKMATALNIRLDGNLILEFPGSTEEEVRETLHALAAVLPFPPLKAASFFLGQGSPVHAEPRRYGIRAITHHANDRLLFPGPVLQRLDLLVKGYRGDRTRQKKLWQPVRRQIRTWQRFHKDRKHKKRPALELRDGGSFLIIRQERPDQPTLHHRLAGLSRQIYLACDTPLPKKRLLARFKTVKENQLNQFLDGLVQKGLLFSDGEAFLALAVRTEPESQN
jgi:ribosomal peptide maturation radical SAM protein 1